jgi:SAM-dependent methyltransferase
MFEYLKPILADAEERASENDKEGMYDALRRLPFEQFNDFLITLPDEQFPAISSLAPRMAPADVQIGWTGNSGRPLLTQSLAFIKTVLTSYALNSKKPLSEAKILDFGCGYGRLIRPFYYYCNADQIYGCDPWDKSLEACADAGIDCHLALSEYLPKELPFTNVKFDLIFAFSVLSKALDRGGILVVTIRPEEYWQNNPEYAAEVAGKIEEHRNNGFAFCPHQREAIDGEVTYGDASMTLDYLRKQCPELAIVGIEHSYVDPWQIIVSMQRP